MAERGWRDGAEVECRCNEGVICDVHFVSGWIEDQMRAGRERTYGYPPDGGLPKLYVESAEMESCVVTAIRNAVARETEE